MKYGYATIALPTLAPEEACIALAAAGFAGIEWAVGIAPHARGSSAEGFMVGNRCTLAPERVAVASAAAIARANGLEVIGLAPYVRSGDLEALEHVLDLASAAGTRQVRLQPPRRDDRRSNSARDLRADFARFLRDAVPLLRASGVSAAVELHQFTIAPSVGLALPLLDGLDPEYVGVIYDVGNLVVEGYEDDRMALELLGPHLHHVHLKNARITRSPGSARTHRWTPLDDGFADVGGFLRLLEEIGYEGWVSIEDLSLGSDSAAAIRANASALATVGAPGWLPQHHHDEEDLQHAQ